MIWVYYQMMGETLSTIGFHYDVCETLSIVFIVDYPNQLVQAQETSLDIMNRIYFQC